MLNLRFYDQALLAINNGQLERALPMLVGKLFADIADVDKWPETRAELHNHPLHAVLLEDPYVGRAATKPRGYAGDAELIDFAYDQLPPAGISQRARDLFAYSTGFQASEGVRQRRNYAEHMLGEAWASGKKICALACGHLRESDPLIGKDLTNVTAVDQDPLSLAKVRETHGVRINLAEANVMHYLRSTAKSQQRFDLIYTLGLTDYFDARAMSLFHKLTRACLAPGGKIVVANFLHGHFAVGWMDAVMDWRLIYRSEAEMEAHATEIGMNARTFRDSSDSVVFCEMSDAADDLLMLERP